jgi:NADH:ubiquinone oxidoreductase subunit B-like Fe-S oxidoreductase
VDLHIVGCPPDPTTLLQGLLALLERAMVAPAPRLAQRGRP